MIMRPAGLHVVTATTIALARPSMEQIVRQIVPARADFCLVHLATRDGIKAVAGAHVSREGERLLRLLMRSYRISPGDGASGVASVMRTRRPLRRTAIQIDEAVVKRGDTRVVDLHRQLAPRSALVVPVLTAIGVAGGLTLCYSETDRVFRGSDLSTAERAAASIAQALTARAANRSPASTQLEREGAPPRRRPALRG